MWKAKTVKNQDKKFKYSRDSRKDLMKTVKRKKMNLYWRQEKA